MKTKLLLQTIFDHEFFIKSVGLTKPKDYEILKAKNKDEALEYFFDNCKDSDVEISPLLSIAYYKSLRQNESVNWGDYIKDLGNYEVDPNPLISRGYLYNETGRYDVFSGLQHLAVHNNYSFKSPTMLISEKSLSRFHNQKPYNKFYTYLRDLQNENISPHPLIDLEYIRKLLLANGISPVQIKNHGIIYLWLINYDLRILPNQWIDSTFFSKNYLAEVFEHKDFIYALFDPSSYSDKSATPLVDSGTLVNQFFCERANNIVNSQLIKGKIQANSATLMQNYINTLRPNQNSAKYYIDALSPLVRGATHYIVAPFLLKGGMEKCVYFYIKALIQEKKNKVILFTTDLPDINNEMFEGLTELISLDRIGVPRDINVKSRIISALILRENPKVLVANSEAGLHAISEYGHLMRKADISVTFYAMQYDQSNNPIGYIHHWLPKIKDKIREIFTDNQTVIDSIRGYLTDEIIKSIQFSPLSMPAQINWVEHATNKSVSGKVLWAGRISSEKLSYLIPKIAELNPNIIFEIWGYFYDGPEVKSKFLSAPNINLMGPFEKFDEVASHDKYDFMLFTSKGEGMPNVIIESLSYGIPVIASSVGGIAEVISEKNGALVTDVYSPESYTEEICEFYARLRNEGIAKFSEAAKSSVKNRNWNNFLVSFNNTEFGKVL